MKTTSEAIFEDFLAANRLMFEKIQEVRESGEYRPDYLVTVNNLQFIFEVKELADDSNFNFEGPSGRVHKREVGQHVRRFIERSRKQISYGAQKGIPSILLIYNKLDPMQMFGTEDMDFITAMHGELTVLIDRNTRQVSEPFNGCNKAVQESKNTSFSAIGRICNQSGKVSVTLFDNEFSKVRIPFGQLPDCFEIRYGKPNGLTLSQS